MKKISLFLLAIFFTTTVLSAQSGYDIGSIATDFKLENKNDILIYPNPTKDIIFVDLENFKANIKIELFDLLGNKLISTSSQKISLKNYRPFYYFNTESRLNKLDKSSMIKVNGVTHYKFK